MTQGLRDLLAILNGFRKFSIMLLLIVVGIMFRTFDLINGSELVNLLQATAVAFFATNIGEHITSTITTWIKNKNTNQK